MMTVSNRVKIIIAGAAGRMGRAVLSAAVCDKKVRIAGAFEQAKNPSVGHDLGELIGHRPLKIPVHPDLRECISEGDAIIDFTSPEVTAQNLALAVAFKKAMVIGTTGMPQELLTAIKKASSKIPVVQAPNMSIGVNLLFRLCGLVGGVLDENYDVEIVEEHHRNKKDAPSGTALEIARLIAKSRVIDFEENAVFGRQGMTGLRKKGTIGIHAVRGGDTIGSHEVCFIADGERFQLSHRATSREAFAIGALRAARFLADKSKGLFSMQDVLGI